MSSETDRFPRQHSDIHDSILRLLWRLIDWRPDAFEIYASVVWAMWGIWLLIDPQSAHPDRYTALFRFLRPEALGAILLVIGALRFCAIVVNAFAIRRAAAFVVAIGWGGIALLLLWSHVGISAAAHVIFSIVSGWSYLRMRE